MTKSLSQKIITDKKNGLSDRKIGNKHGVNYKFIEKVITKSTGINIADLSNYKKKIKELSPKNFNLEKTTVWSFKSRGSWATHNGNYRGNWSPYIPRNIILRYSKENDLVLDYFCGAGSTAVESKLLGRNFLGIDINPNAIELARINLDFGERNIFYNSDINLRIGDARNLKFINEESVDLICAHPPYSDIINYTHDNPSDLSNYKVDRFLEEMGKVAEESYRVLKNKKYCSILIGDMRKNKNVIPLGFRTIEKYIKAGFQIEELIIKRQHNCKTTGFWYTNSIKYNFLLLAHEYLVVFKKIKNIKKQSKINKKINFINRSNIKIDKNIKLESKTVWIFNQENWLNNTISNLIKRYSSKNYHIDDIGKNIKNNLELLILSYNEELVNKIDLIKYKLGKDGILAVICEDIRLDNNRIFPTAIEVEKELDKLDEFSIKELIVVSIENGEIINDINNLRISHKYILLYKRN